MTLLSELIRAIVVAWKSRASYPPEHPSVVSATAAATRLLQGHLLAAHQLTLGVASDGLLHGDDKLTIPHARELAEALHRHDVAVLAFEEGVSAEELSGLLHLLASELPTAGPRPLAEDLAAARITHITVAALDFSGIRATEDLAEPGARQVSLWDEVVRTVLKGKPLSSDGLRLLGLGQPLSAKLVTDLVRDCLTQLGASPGELGLAGQQLGEELAGAIGQHLGRSQGMALRREVAEQIVAFARGLPAALREMLLDAALRVLATDEADPEPLRLMAEAFEPDTVMQAFQRLSLSGVRLSRHGLQMLETLSRSARPQPRLGPADLQLVRELSALFREEDIERHSPGDHQALFKAAATLEFPAVSPAPAAQEETRGRLTSMSEASVGGILAASLLDTLERQGSREGFEAVLRRLEDLYRTLLRKDQVEQAVQITESLRSLRNTTRSSELEVRLVETMARLASDEAIGVLVDALPHAGPAAPGLVRRLGEALGAVVIRNLLLTLASEQDRVRRRRIFDTLTSLGLSVVDHATLLLGDTRWFVLRNMVALLRAAGDRNTLPDVRKLARHPDLRVRLEAIKSLFQLDSDVPHGLLDEALGSADPKEAEAAVVLVGNYGINEGLEPLLALLQHADLRGRHRSIRVSALRALGELGDPAALLRLDRFFREGWWWLVSAEERRAAFESLSGYPADARAALVLRGQESRDPKIRATCSRLAREDAAAPVRAEVS